MINFVKSAKLRVGFLENSLWIARALEYRSSGLPNMGFRKGIFLTVGYFWLIHQKLWNQPNGTKVSRAIGGKGHGNPFQDSYLDNPVDRGACWAAIYGVTQSRTRLKQLSSSSSSSTQCLVSNLYSTNLYNGEYTHFLKKDITLE